MAVGFSLRNALLLAPAPVFVILACDRREREDTARNASIVSALKGGQSWSQIVDGMGCSRATVAKLAK